MKKIIQFFKFESISDDLRRKIFYIFYVFFFVALIIYVGYSKNNDEVEKVTSDVNYEFRYEIIDNGIEYILFGTRYNNEMILTKRVEGIEYKYYRNYDNWYVLENDKYVLYTGDIIAGLDVNLINKQYIEDLLDSSTIVSSEENVYVLNNADSGITFEKHYTDEVLDYVILTKDQLSIKYIYYYDSVSSIDININND